MLLLRLFRVKQWIKNFFIIIPFIFSGRFLEGDLWIVCFKTMLGFSFIASAFYILNDVIDRDNDRLHPMKSKRPIAAGRISVGKAIICAVLSLGVGALLIGSLDRSVWVMVFLYIFVQIIYNVLTKHWVILDVLTVAAGFLIRVWIGALAIGVVPSMWLHLCVFVLALFLGFTKRRYELATLRSRASGHRSVLSEYTVRFLDQMIIICSTLAIVFYSLYTISAEVTHRIGHAGLLYSVGFVIYGIFRYLYLVHVKKMGDDPGDLLLRDGPLLLNICAWLTFVMISIVSAGR